jgi:hypothetical protein
MANTHTNTINRMEHHPKADACRCDFRFIAAKAGVLAADPDFLSKVSTNDRTLLDVTGVTDRL